jgi:predicted RNase H-like HicB family nuclease
MKKEMTYIVLTYMINKEEKMFFAHCPELDIGSQGETVEEANNNLKDAVGLYLNTIEGLGTREEIFKKKDIKIYSYKPKPMLEKNKMPRSFNNFPFITQQAIPLNL